jgi:rfaE bifunctional protein kinase chain/domain
MHNKIQQAFEAFSNMTVLIIGDAMIDAYVYGIVNRMSPEAPVPVVDVEKRENRLGGAANVARNIQSMGAKPILCTVIGKDIPGKQFLELMRIDMLNDTGIVRSPLRTTTVKTRIISGSRQIARIDEEIIESLSADDEDIMFSRISELIKTESIDAIIFEDYDKGNITQGLIERVVSLANEKNIPTTVDPKNERFLEYKNVSLFKPNFKELEEGLDIKIRKEHNAIADADQQLRSELNHGISLITLSEKGVFISDKISSKTYPAHIRNISDVSGAGDTVIAVATLCLAAGLDTATIAQVSNLAGGLVCENAGVVSIDKQNLLDETLSII